MAEQLADLSLKVVITGGMAGGGIGAFWSLFKDSDIPKAIAAAVIGLGISYGASLLKPLHDGNNSLLQKSHNATTDDQSPLPMTDSAMPPPNESPAMPFAESAA